MNKPPPYSGPRSGQISPAHTQQTHSEESFDSTFHSYLHVLVKRKLGIIFAVVFFLIASFLINFTQTPVYESSAEMVFEIKTPSDSVQDASNAAFTRDPTFLMTQARMLRGPHFAERVVDALDAADQLKLLRSYGRQISSRREEQFEMTEPERTFLENAVRRSISLQQVTSGARIIELVVSGYDPQLCALVANTAADVYVLVNHESHIELFQKRFAMTNKSLTDIREKIKTSELALDKVNAEIKLLDSLKVFGELYPEVVTLKKAVEDSSRQLQALQGNLMQSQVGQKQDMLSLIVKPHTDLTTLESIATDLHNLKGVLEQEIETNREIYNSVYKRVQEMELTGGSSVWVDLKVIQAASVPSKPVRPNKTMNLFIGLMVGLLVGIGLAFFLEYLDSSVRTLDDVKGHLKVTPLGIVPEVEFDSEDLDAMRVKAKNEGASRIMWNTQDLKIPLYVAEAYRIIRTNFVFGAIDKSLKIFQVTSAVKGEGKTTTTVNLGISLAQVGMRVLLVDADLRRPSLHKTLHLGTNSLGLNQVLTGQASFESVIQNTQITNLSAVPSGGIPAHPAEMLSSLAMRKFMEQAREMFDVVLIDSPPVISVADAPVIASHVDGTLLVVRAGYIPRRLTLQAKKSIEAVNGSILGAILNGVSSAHHPYYYYRYYTDNYYTYYGSEKEGKTGRRRRSPIRSESASGFEKFKLTVLSMVPGPLRSKLMKQENEPDLEETENSSSKLTV